MKQTVTNPAKTETRQRLLDAAGEVFAEYGFRRATVREICRRAKANVAAVNYHFGDKAGLYVAVLRYAHRSMIEQYPPDLGLRSATTAEQQLHAFVRSFLFRILAEGHLAWHGKLMAQEIMRPTQALDALVEEEIRPLSKQLEAIVQALLGPHIDHDHVRLCALSIVGQCLFYHHAQPVIVRLYPDQQFNTQDIEQLADHITQFSLRALKQLSRGNGGDSK